MKTSLLKDYYEIGAKEKANQPVMGEQPCAVELEVAKSLVPLCYMSDSHLTELLRHAAVKTVFLGEAIFESGVYDRQHIYLLHGDVELLDDNSDAVLVRASESVEPIAHYQPRPCRAMAKTDCSILCIDSDLLDKLLAWSQVAEYLQLDISYQRDLDEDLDWMMTVLRSNLFYKIPPTNAHLMFGCMKSMVVHAGEAIIRQGEIGDNCYFIKQGDAEVRQSLDNSSIPVKVADIGPGRCFGEDALVYETVRNASVIMKTDGVLMYMSKRDFIKLLREPKVEEVDSKTAIQCVDNGYVCIDVRTESEYNNSHRNNAINIPLNLLRIKTRILKPGQHYLVYCDSGRRSRAAAYLLNRCGFDATVIVDAMGDIEPMQLNGFGLASGFLLRDGEVVADH